MSAIVQQQEEGGKVTAIPQTLLIPRELCCTLRGAPPPQCSQVMGVLGYHAALRCTPGRKHCSAVGCSSSSAPWCIDRVQTGRDAPDNSPNHDAATLPATRMRYTASQHQQPMMQPHFVLTRLCYTEVQCCNRKMAQCSVKVNICAQTAAQC